MTEVSDADLVARTRSGDTSAFDELYRQHVADATTVARIVSHNSDEVPDIVAEAFTRVLAQLRAGLGPDSQFSPYLRTIIRRLAIDRHRRSLRDGGPADPTVLEALPRTDDPMARATDRELVRRAFDSLPHRWQKILWHTEIEGHSPASLAEVLDSSPNTIAALAYRARNGLRHAYLALHLSSAVADSCRPFSPKIPGYARGALSPQDTEAVTTHLAGCPDCRERRDDLLLLASDLRGVLGPALLLPVVGGGALAATSAGAGATAGGLLGWLSPARWAAKGGHTLAATSGVVAAVAIVAVAVVVLGGSDSDPSPETTPPPVAQTEVDAPQQPPAPSSPPAPVEVESVVTAESPESEIVAVGATPDPRPMDDGTSLAPTVPPESPVSTPTAVAPAPVPLLAAPTFDLDPVDAEVRAGDAATFSVAVSGTPAPMLRWQYREPADPDLTTGLETSNSPWVDVDAATSFELTITPVTPDLDGSQFRVVAENAAGQAISATAGLVVHYAEVVRQPRGQTVEPGSTVVFAAAARGNPDIIGARWQVHVPGGSWADHDDHHGESEFDHGEATLRLPGVGLGHDGNEYRVIFVSADGAETVSRPAVLTVTASARPARDA